MKKNLFFAVLICMFIFPISCSGRDALDVSALAPVNDSVSMKQEDSDLQICVSKCVQSLRNKSEPQNSKCVNSAEFIEDVTVPDGTVLSPGEHFRKVWRLKNTGTCTWSRSYKVVSSGMFHMGGSQYAYLADTVEPGETADISMNLIAPVIYGNFESEYMLEDDNGIRFGITGTRTKKEMPFWLKVTVTNPSDCSVVRVSPYAVWRFSDFDAVFRIKNNSDAVWNTDEIDVRIISGADYLKYPERGLIDLPESVKPGEAGTIIFDMIAPDFQGDSEITIQLLKEQEVICTVTNRITFL